MSRKPIDKQIAENAPRGQEHYWKVMQQLDCEVGFTLDAVYRKTNASKVTVKEYIGRLLKAGYLEVASSEKDGIITRYHYTIAKRSRYAPRINRSGVECPPTKRDIMWRTMRMNKRFTVDELVIWASLPEVTIKRNEALDYTKHLARAGYLKISGKTYSFIKDTGPLPPKIQKIKQVFDPNLNKVVWRPEAQS
ncbi:hypothetical protein [Maridesulfovibrio hydrothermalis]|uniref:Uncharacterized protein n=1 Tax=Maridesulfovibrio hydrothermalis AM13 = DSM 14728 TaxID=1121451 RepID=L0R686_9BACT|nr:hypothetical protein [Maridesulfovibrio hydrothermalis]CCO22204.1 conserved protein of unknown function [Maridesulfovibrio hydrothermalis AM13 = DSM 14728]